MSYIAFKHWDKLKIALVLCNVLLWTWFSVKGWTPGLTLLTNLNIVSSKLEDQIFPATEVVRTLEKVELEPPTNGNGRQASKPNELEISTSSIPPQAVCGSATKGDVQYNGSALMCFCEAVEGYPEIWSNGVQLLGLEEMISFTRDWRQYSAQLADRSFRFWGYKYDRKARGMLNEQISDAYALKTRLSKAGDGWILDFGGNMGYTAINMALIAPTSHVLTLEPSPWNYVLLRANLAQSKLHGKVTAINAGMGGTGGTLHGTHYFNASAGTSVLSARSSSLKRGAFSSPIVTLSDLMTKHHIESIVLMKLDCEGCEWSAVPSWVLHNLSKKIPVIVGEFHYTVKDRWPSDLTLEKARSVYKFLCCNENYFMHKGCRKTKVRENQLWQTLTPTERKYCKSGVGR